MQGDKFGSFWAKFVDVGFFALAALKIV